MDRSLNNIAYCSKGHRAALGGEAFGRRFLAWKKALEWSGTDEERPGPVLRPNISHKIMKYRMKGPDWSRRPNPCLRNIT
jgi:hypothetical protein